MADVKEAKQVESREKLQLKPPPRDLTHTSWLAVADLLVDYSYQHRPYANAIEALNRDFQEAYSGYILVNERVDKTRWILDGQTRHAVHQLRKLPWIQAEMLHGLTQAEEARVYLIKCINAKRMPVDFFLAEYVAQQPEAVLIHNLMKKYGIEIESYATTQRKRGSSTTPVVTCVSTLKRLLRRDETGEVLQWSLELIRDTWEFSGNSLTAPFLDAMHKLLLWHADDLDRNAFVSKLSVSSPEELRDKAGLLRLGTTPQMTVTFALQQVIIDVYNMNRPQARRITLGSPNRSATL